MGRFLGKMTCFLGWHRFEQIQVVFNRETISVLRCTDCPYFLVPLEGGGDDYKHFEGCC